MNRRDSFLQELRALLMKYDAQITADDHWQGYAECGRDVRMTVEFKDWNVEDIDLGTWIDSTETGSS